MTEIQGNIVKRNKRNAIFRRFHKKNDNKAVAAWVLDLNRILGVLNVRSVTSVWSLLTFRFQADVETNTHVTDVSIRHDAANTHPTVSDVRSNISDANNIVPIAPCIRRTTLKRREEVGDQDTVVSTSFTISVTE